VTMNGPKHYMTESSARFGATELRFRFQVEQIEPFTSKECGRPVARENQMAWLGTNHHVGQQPLEVIP
jgi:hypothetical protein